MLLLKGIYKWVIKYIGNCQNKYTAACGCGKRNAPSLLFLDFFSFRQFQAALTDLWEAIKLCPGNQEIKRLLTRVEEECKQLQRTQQQKQQCFQAMQQSNDSDYEGEVLVQDHFSLEEIKEEELLCEQEPGPARPRLPLFQASLSCSRNLQEGTQQKFRPASPPNRASSAYLREPGLSVQPTKQAQIVKTSQHLNSVQAAARPSSSQSGTKIQHLQYLPPSPVTSRHLMTPNNKAQHLDGAHTVSAGSSSALFNERLAACQLPYLQHSDKGPSFMSKSKTHEKLSVHPPPSLSQGTGELRQQSSASSLSVNMVPSSSTSSFSESMAGQNLETRLKENKAGLGQSGSVEHRSRSIPFMGIMDKTVRFQQQQMNPLNRSWHSQATEGVLKSSGTTLSASCEFSSKPPSHSASQGSSFFSSPLIIGDNLQNGTQSKELEELKHQASASPQDNRIGKPVAHLYQEALSKQHSQLSKDIHSSHITSTKPKRSFVESNV